MTEQRVFLTPENEDQWLEWRKSDITSTEIAALFDCHSYGETEYSLYHTKKGNIVKEWKDNDRMAWGRRLEATIAMGIAEDLGLVVEPFKDYGRMPELRMGSSFDFRVVGIADNWDGEDDTYRNLFLEHGPGLVEVKNVDGLVFRRGWIEDAGVVEAPPQIELQMQYQMEVSGYNWCLGAPLIAGNTPKPFYRLRDNQIGAAMRLKVSQFWDRFDRDDEPEPDYEKDGDSISTLYLNSSEESVDLSDNMRMAELCHAHKAASDQEKEGKAKKDAAKAEMLTIIGSASKVIAPDGFKISATTTKESEGTLITDSMVGTRYGARRSFRNFRVTAKKK